MKRMFIAAFFALATIVTAARPAHADGAQVFQFHVDYTQGVACVLAQNQPVHLVGDINLVSNVTIDSSGGLHILFHENYQGLTGVDANGNTYSGPGVANESINAKVGVVSSFNEQVLLISHGSNPNLIYRVTFMYVVNADGSLTVWKSAETLNCIG